MESKDYGYGEHNPYVPRAGDKPLSEFHCMFSRRPPKGTDKRGETEQHKSGKQVLHEGKRLLLPSFAWDRDTFHFVEIYVPIEITNVETEKTIRIDSRNKIRADVWSQIQVNGKSMEVIFEICYHKPKSIQEIQKYAAAGVPVFEVNINHDGDIDGIALLYSPVVERLKEKYSTYHWYASPTFTAPAAREIRNTARLPYPIPKCYLTPSSIPCRSFIGHVTMSWDIIATAPDIETATSLLIEKYGTAYWDVETERCIEYLAKMLRRNFFNTSLL